MTHRSLLAVTLLVLASLANATTAVAPRCSADVVTAWNERVLAIAEAEDHFLTLKGVRTAAMMHIAMHDAINSIHRHYSAYTYASQFRPDADPVSAAAQAAHVVALAQYPDQRIALDEELHRWLDSAPRNHAKRKAIELGTLAAQAILVKREKDGWNKEVEYQWGPTRPGVYAEFRDHSGTPQGFVFGVGWATAKPFALRAPQQFRVGPPPRTDSSEYAQAYQEVLEDGRYDSTSRTNDQTHMALWWKDFAESSHNRLARQLIAANGADLWTVARLFALLNMSIFDGYIASFDSKFFYNHWRPYTAIRAAHHDDNPRTQPEPTWNNLHQHTYAFPSYPSAHGTVCAAGMAVLADTFGNHYEFTMETREVDSAGPLSPRIRMDPPTRSFANFSSAAMECAISRIYLGIHFRYDSVVGNQLGRQVGAYAIENYLRAVGPRSEDIH